MNLDQPRKQHNYTQSGFKKLKTPLTIFRLLQEFFQKHRNEEKAESWPSGSTYVNHWDSPTTMISFEDPSFPEGLSLKSQIWNSLKPVIESWVGHAVEPTSLYGIRVYKKGAMLATRK
jgi:prolyl 4-hydroxylase